MTPTFPLAQLGSLVYPVMLCQQSGKIGESKAAELLGMRIECYREKKAEAVGAVMSLVESLPSPLTLLLDGTSGQPSCSTKKS